MQLGQVAGAQVGGGSGGACAPSRRLAPQNRSPSRLSPECSGGQLREAGNPPCVDSWVQGHSWQNSTGGPQGLPSLIRTRRAKAIGQHSQL